MSRKDFELIAKTIREMPLNGVARVIVATEFAAKLATTNPRFDRPRFLHAATGINE